MTEADHSMVGLLRRGSEMGAADVVVGYSEDRTRVLFKIEGVWHDGPEITLADARAFTMSAIPFCIRTSPVFDGDDVVVSRFGGPLHAKAVISPSPERGVVTTTVRLCPSFPQSEGEVAERPSASFDVEEALADYDMVVAGVGVENVSWDVDAVRRKIAAAAVDGKVGAREFLAIMSEAELQRVLKLL